MNKQERRFGVVVVPVDDKGNIWSIAPLIDENHNKMELVVDHQNMLESFEGKREFPAGAVEARDGTLSDEKTVLLAAAREAAEETGIILPMNYLSISDMAIVVEQIRHGEKVTFDVAIVLWPMTAGQLAWLSKYCDGRIVDNNEQDFSSLRPRDRIVSELVYEKLFDILPTRDNNLLSIDSD